MRKSLEEIYLEHGVRIRNEKGFLINPIDLLEIIYLRLSPENFKEIEDEIRFQETMFRVFEDERKKGDWTL